MTDILDSILEQQAQKQTRKPATTNGGRVDVERYLSDHSVPVRRTKENDGGTMYLLEACVFDSNHTANEAAVCQADDGKLTYQCFHDSCKGRQWADARRAISGDAKLGPWMVGGNGHTPTRTPATANRAIPAEPDANTPAIELFNGADWLSSEPPPPDQVLGDMLDTGDKMALVAASKQRKSFLFLMLALALASGRDLLKWRVPQPRRVAYIQFEIRKHHNHRRLKSLARAMGIAPHNLGDRLLIIPGRGLGLKGVEGLERIQQAVADFRPEVIMLDPLYKIADGVENAAEDFKVLLNAFDQFAERTGASVLFVHHDTKGAPGDKDIRDRGAGSGVLGRDYDACITLTAHASEPDAAVVETLLRNYPPQEAFTIEWKNGEYGYCFTLAEDVLPEKKTSKSKAPPPPFAAYLPIASEILIAGREVEVSFFKAEFKQRTRLGDHRIRDFLNWATGGERPHMVTREERGNKLHKKWVKMALGDGHTPEPSEASELSKTPLTVQPVLRIAEPELSPPLRGDVSVQLSLKDEGSVG